MHSIADSLSFNHISLLKICAKCSVHVGADTPVDLIIVSIMNNVSST